MRTLVTGAAGFIGTHVTRLLRERGREVRAMLAPGEDAHPLAELDVEVVRGDVRDSDACHAAVAGCDRVFHLAAIYKLWAEDEKVLFDVNVTGTANMLWACRKAEVERVVYTSSIAALGQRQSGDPVDEETPFNLWKDGNAYVQSKYLSEQLALTFAREGAPVVVVNPTFPFGVGDRGPTPTGGILVNLLKRRAPGILDGGFNAIDVEDVAAGHLLAEAKGRVGERYILGHRNITFTDFTRLIGEVTGRKLSTRRMPYSLYYGVATVAELISDHLTHKAPIATRKAVKYVHFLRYFDASKSRRELGLPQTDLRETIAKAARWFESNGYLDGSRS